jgi:predicted anti-sigma-YlaC factor YlaD
MKCERIQELILTDYLDEQLSADQKKHIDQHLSGCAHCRLFAQTARQTAFEPFVKAERLQPAASVWEGIKEQIEASQERTNIFANLWENIVSLVRVPNPAVVMVTIVSVLVVGGLTGMKVREQASAKDDVEYLDSLATPGALSFNDKGFDTGIEQYFL